MEARLERACFYCGSVTDLRPRKFKTFECAECYRQRLEAEDTADMAFTDDECDVVSELGLRRE